MRVYIPYIPRVHWIGFILYLQFDFIAMDYFNHWTSLVSSVHFFILCDHLIALLSQWQPSNYQICRRNHQRCPIQLVQYTRAKCALNNTTKPIDAWKVIWTCALNAMQKWNIRWVILFLLKKRRCDFFGFYFPFSFCSTGVCPTIAEKQRTKIDR